MQDAGQAVVEHADRGHQVQAEEREVGEVVAGERLGLEVGVHQAKAAESDLAGARAADVRELELVGVPHHHLLHLTLAVEQHADLAMGVPRELGEVPRQFCAHNLVRRPRAGGKCCATAAIRWA